MLIGLSYGDNIFIIDILSKNLELKKLQNYKLNNNGAVPLSFSLDFVTGNLLIIYSNNRIIIVCFDTLKVIISIYVF